MYAWEIRKAFLKYFAGRGHSLVPSSSLLPLEDPTLLFTNAGMVQFKDIFTGKSPSKFKRAASSQKCVRAGGKHNDLENVGFTPRHHTFFEMLGNFSFGDYFKVEAIEFAWEFLTKIIQLDPERLSVTIFRDDDEAETLWQKRVGLPLSRITRHGEEDNFWAMGDTGPCGPCSEIHYDLGEGFEKQDRVLEIWNLVFMQFERDAKGNMKPLPKPSIDTGMGLERLSAVKQGVKSNFETDLLKPIIDYAANLAGLRYGDKNEIDTSLRVIADHSRATAFLMADGVTPSNEGAGYVLRRIMRRAIRHGNKLELQEAFLYKTALKVVELMGEVYPELLKNKNLIQESTRREEERFSETLHQGLLILESEMGAKKKKILSGELIFKLYDTYGFPVDLTQTIAGERGFSLDMSGYEQEMAKQRDRSQHVGKGIGKSTSDEKKFLMQLKKDIPEVGFLGYQSLTGKAKVLQVLQGIDDGDDVVLITDKTPFYGESGGQVGDQGVISSPSGFQFQVLNTTKFAPGIILHHGKILAGKIHSGEEVSLSVDQKRRGAVLLNHSATHLLHAALRAILGKHVQQKGSLVAPDRLRFDFSHFEGIASSQLQEIENLCNEEVRRNHRVSTEVLPYQEALATGAMALFGEKYGDRVRVVRMGEFSVELCGGTHVSATGEIGLIRLRAESGIASGVRRIEAVTGQVALDSLHEQETELKQIAERLKTGASAREIENKVAKLLEEQKKLEQELKKWQAKPTQEGQIREIKGIKVLRQRVDDMDPKGLRNLADQLRDRLKSGIVALGSSREGKVSLLVMVTKDLTSRYSAGDFIKEMAKHVEGSGGGRADLAQAGGTKPEGLDKALETIDILIES